MSPVQSPPQNPNSESAPWLQAGDAKRTAVKEMFSAIAPSYDRMNRLMSLNLDRRWRRAAAGTLQLKEGQTVLDLCCGTGDFLPILRGLVGTSGKLLGLDFCLPMLVGARDKECALLGVGDACAIPLCDAAVDAVTVGWGIRNVPDIDRAHQEIFRVLKPGGRFVSVDMAIPRNGLIRRLSEFGCGTLIPRLGAWLSDAQAYKYLPESTQRFATREQLCDSMQRAGFVSTGWKDMFFGNICIHWGQKA